MKDNQKEPEHNDVVTFLITPLSSRQLAGMYGVCRKTMKNWLARFADEIGQKHGRLYTNAQVKIIIQKLGMPSEIIKG